MRLYRILCWIWLGCLPVTRGFSQEPIPPIGQWRDHLPYHAAVDLSYGDHMIFCATPYSFYSVDLTENTVKRFSRTNGLHETGISRISYNEAGGKLLVAYQNSDLDLFFRNDIIHIPDIKIDNITGDKTIYHIFPFNNRFYLSTGLGIIVIDADRYEVKDTWFISNTGGQVRINGFLVQNGFYYAATEEGLKSIPLAGSDPANYRNWQLISGMNGLPAGPCKGVSAAQGKVFVLKGNSVFVQDGSNWTLFFTDPGWIIRNMNSASGKLLICLTKTGDNSRVISFNPDGTIADLFQQSGIIAKPEKAIFYNNEYWVADSVGGLTVFRSPVFQSYALNSPYSVSSGEILFRDQVFYGASGEVNRNWQGLGNKNGVFLLRDGQWTNYNNRQFALFDSLPDLITLAIDPRDESVWAGSFGGGLLNIHTDNSFGVFKQNSGIGPALADPASYRVSGLAFDKENNLWISNYGAANNIVVRKNDNTWSSFIPPFPLFENAVSQILIDKENQKWIISPGGNGLLCFNDGNTIGNTGDDRWILYRAGQGNGNLPSSNVLSLAMDHNGFIWIGTEDGIGVIQCPENIFSGQGCEAVLPVVQQGGFNQYLFKGEQVNCIAVDGADRKWIGTANGAWLISPEGDEVIYRFTETNSPLLGNLVKKIAIDERTGEIYFATGKGVCSFRSTATAGGERIENVLVFPNPVPPDYDGTIAIRGLVNEAIVKITELDGRLVFQTRALGGQAIWNGRDYRGRKVSTGIYLVLVSDENGKENLAAKIVFINK